MLLRFGMTKCQVLRERKKIKSFDPIDFQIKFNWKLLFNIEKQRWNYPFDGFPVKERSVKDTDSIKASNKEINHKLQ